MTYLPALPMSGYAGWKFLERTRDQQISAFTQSPGLKRDTEHFRETIGSVTSAEELVSDFRLLRVALTAFGLQDDLPNRYFVKRILSDGVAAQDALANRLADKRYRDFSAAFGFGTSLPPRTVEPGFADRILSRFQARAFEEAVGEQDQSLQLALNAARELPELASAKSEDATLWLRVMGTPPLRAVFETALGLPSSIGTLDLDRQLELFRTQSAERFGSPLMSQFSEPDKVQDLVQTYLARHQISQVPTTTSAGSIALILLQSSAANSAFRI